MKKFFLHGLAALLILTAALAGCSSNHSSTPPAIPTIYAATGGGLSISSDGGATFVNKTNGLGSTEVYGVCVSGGTIYVATANGLAISTDGGESFDNKTNWSGSTIVTDVYVSGGTIYASNVSTESVDGGLLISNNGGATFVKKTVVGEAGAPENSINAVYVSEGGTIYAATYNGVAISYDAGESFSIVISGEYVLDVYVSGGTIYAATAENGLATTMGFGAASFRSFHSEDVIIYSVNGVYVSGEKIYVATDGGLSISTDGGETYVDKVITDGETDYGVYRVYVSGGKIYASAADEGGLFISDDGGATFVKKTTANGLGDNQAYRVYVQ